MSVTPARVRSLYRSMLRELPPRPISSLSPIKQRIRSSFSSEKASSGDLANKVQQGEQFVVYVKAQRMYITLLERYNPGMSMDEEDRVRLTAKRVGMDLPEKH